MADCIMHDTCFPKASKSHGESECDDTWLLSLALNSPVIVWSIIYRVFIGTKYKQWVFVGDKGDKVVFDGSGFRKAFWLTYDFRYKTEMSLKGHKGLEDSKYVSAASNSIILAQWFERCLSWSRGRNCMNANKLTPHNKRLATLSPKGIQQHNCA